MNQVDFVWQCNPEQNYQIYQINNFTTFIQCKTGIYIKKNTVYIFCSIKTYITESWCWHWIYFAERPPCTSAFYKLWHIHRVSVKVAFAMEVNISHGRIHVVHAWIIMSMFTRLWQKNKSCLSLTWTMHCHEYWELQLFP